jgi:regulator of replication initiation timing
MFELKSRFGFVRDPAPVFPLPIYSSIFVTQPQQGMQSQPIPVTEQEAALLSSHKLVQQLRAENSQLRSEVSRVASENAQVKLKISQVLSENAQVKLGNAQIVLENAQVKLENAQIIAENLQLKAQLLQAAAAAAAVNKGPA